MFAAKIAALEDIMAEEKKNCGCNDEHEECNCTEEHGDCNCEEEYDYLTLEFDDGEVECAIIDEFKMDGKNYLVLLPDEEDDAYIYSFKEDEENGIELTNLEEPEFNKAVAEYMKRAEENE